MISVYRHTFNTNYQAEKYEQFIAQIHQDMGYKIEFKISETPIFLPETLKNHLITATKEILEQLDSENYLAKAQHAIPENCFVPNENKTPDFITIDFAICKNSDGTLIPKLIELQAFPSLFFFQAYLNRMYRKYYEIDEKLTNFFHGFSEEEYLEHLRKLIVGTENPENVILLEIEPEKQKTRIDFDWCERMLGVQAVCLTKVIKRGRQVFYEHEGKEIQIKRIYNRVIFDELQLRTDLELDFQMTDDVEVDWVGHPNWFFKISKFSLPFLDSQYVPKTYFLDNVEEIPADLENYVLKPLFSFAGSGVKFDVKPEDIADIPEAEKSNYILMQKVQYEPLIQTLDIPAKVEARLMVARNPETNQPEVLTDLVRLSKDKMMGVDFNKNKIWVGGTVGYFEK